MKAIKTLLLGAALLFVGGSSLFAHSHFSLNLGLFPFCAPPCRPVYVPPPPPPCYYYNYYPRPVYIQRPCCPYCCPHSHVVIHEYTSCQAQ